MVVQAVVVAVVLTAAEAVGDNMADWLNTEVPHWLAARTQERDPTQAVIAGMQFGANQQQRQFDNALKLKEFGAQEQSRALQNRLMQMRIDTDAHDAAQMEKWFPEFQKTTGDALHSFQPPPLLDQSRYLGAQRMIASKIAAEAGLDAERLDASITANAVKQAGDLHPTLQYGAWDILRENGGKPNQEFQEYIELNQPISVELKQAESLAQKTAEAELIRKRQIDVATIRANAIKSRVHGEANLEQALMRHTGTVMRQENLSYSEAQDAIRAEWNATHAATAPAGTTESPASRKISQTDEVRLKDIGNTEERLNKMLDTVEETIANTSNSEAAINVAKKRKSDLEQKLRDNLVKKTNILQKYEPVEKRPGLGELRASEANQVKTTLAPKVQTQADIDEAIRQANEAIQKGKDPAAVRARLKEMGIQLKE